MNYITTTQLRTNVPDLIQALLDGFSVDLIHRSKIIGTFAPKKILNSTKLKKTIDEINLKHG